MTTWLEENIDLITMKMMKVFERVRADNRHFPLSQDVLQIASRLPATEEEYENKAHNLFAGIRREEMSLIAGNLRLNPHETFTFKKFKEAKKFVCRYLN